MCAHTHTLLTHVKDDLGRKHVCKKTTLYHGILGKCSRHCCPPNTIPTFFSLRILQLYSAVERQETVQDRDRGEPCLAKPSRFILLDNEISDKIDWEALGEYFLPDKINTHTHTHTHTHAHKHTRRLPPFPSSCFWIRLCEDEKLGVAAPRKGNITHKLMPKQKCGKRLAPGWHCWAAQPTWNRLPPYPRRSCEIIRKPSFTHLQLKA